MSPDPVASENEAVKVSLADFLAILRSRLRLIVAPAIVALILAVCYLATATRTYTGTTSLLIDARVRPAVGDTANLPNYSPDAILVESQVRLISSDTVLRRVVEAEHLDVDPEFGPGKPGLRTRLMLALGFGSTSTESADEAVPRALLNFTPHVVVKRSERTYIADIEVTSSDPVKAARLANAVAQAYLDDQQAARNDAADRDSGWVRGQISAMQTGLQEAELRADAYKRQNGIFDTNGKVLTEQELADASAGLTAARVKATEVKARLDQIQRIVSSGRNLDALPDALKSPLIDKLRGQYADISRQQAILRQTLGDRHPALLESEQQIRDVRRLIAEELTRIQAGIVNENQTAQANVVSLEKHVQDLKQGIGVSNQTRVRLDELQRDVDARRAVYDRFLRARDTVREQTVDAPIGRVIAPAVVPSSPTSPKTFAVLLLALAGGLGAGVGLALLLDLTSGTPKPTTTVAAPLGRRPETARPKMPAEAVPEVAPAGIAVLGFVPAPFGTAVDLASRSWLLDRLRTAWPTTIEAEHVASLPAFRTAIHALGLLDEEAKPSPTILLVTALDDAAGRTTLALGLAEAAAAQGRRALVIDADHQGDLMRELVTPGARPGLIDVMGTTRLCYRVVAPYRGTLSIVPIMPGEAQIARRLQGQAATLHIDGIAENFDYIVFDGPNIEQRERLEAMAETADTMILVAPRDSTREDLDRAAGTLTVPSTCRAVAVLVANMAPGNRSSEAA